MKNKLVVSSEGIKIPIVPMCPISDFDLHPGHSGTQDAHSIFLAASENIDRDRRSANADYLQAIALGSAPAALHIGLWHLTMDELVTLNLEYSCRFLRKAAKYGSEHAKLALAYLGCYLRSNIVGELEGRQYLRGLAEAGLGVAVFQQVLLDEACGLDHIDVLIGLEKAASCARPSAGAAMELGMRFHMGVHTAIDLDLAAAWYRRAIHLIPFAPEPRLGLFTALIDGASPIPLGDIDSAAFATTSVLNGQIFVRADTFALTSPLARPKSNIQESNHFSWAQKWASLQRPLGFAPMSIEASSSFARALQMLETASKDWEQVINLLRVESDLGEPNARLLHGIICSFVFDIDQICLSSDGGQQTLFLAAKSGNYRAMLWYASLLDEGNNSHEALLWIRRAGRAFLDEFTNSRRL